MYHHFSLTTFLKAQMICCSSLGRFCGVGNLTVSYYSRLLMIQKSLTSGRRNSTPSSPPLIEAFLHFKSRFQSDLKSPTIISSMKQGSEYVHTNPHNPHEFTKSSRPSFATEIIKLNYILLWVIRSRAKGWASSGWSGELFVNITHQAVWESDEHTGLLLCISETL